MARTRKDCCCTKIRDGQPCRMYVSAKDREKNIRFCWIHRNKHNYEGASSRGGKGCAKPHTFYERCKESSKIANNTDQDIQKQIQKLIHQWMKDLTSGGSNNSISYGGLKRVIDAMNNVTPITKKSVFIDMGSGAGIPCIYVALKYGCHTIGIEYDAKLVAIARKYAKQNGVEHLCTFVAKDFNDLPKNYLEDKKVSHLFTYDGVFNSNVWNPLFDRIESTHQKLVGASVSKFSHHWPANLKLVTRVPSVKLAGGKSSFTFGIWTKAASRVPI